MTDRRIGDLNVEEVSLHTITDTPLSELPGWWERNKALAAELEIEALTAVRQNIYSENVRRVLLMRAATTKRSVHRAKYWNDYLSYMVAYLSLENDTPVEIALSSSGELTENVLLQIESVLALVKSLKKEKVSPLNSLLSSVQIHKAAVLRITGQYEAAEEALGVAKNSVYYVMDSIKAAIEDLNIALTKVGNNDEFSGKNIARSWERLLAIDVSELDLDEWYFLEQTIQSLQMHSEHKDLFAQIAKSFAAKKAQLTAPSNEVVALNQLLKKNIGRLQ